MNTRALTALVLAPLTFAMIGACSAPAESVDSSNEALNRSPIHLFPAPPPWPVPNASYCPNVLPNCVATEETYDFDLIPTDSQLQSEGCTPPIHFLTGTPNGLIADWVAVCYDTPSVRAIFTLDTFNSCNACLPQLPAGQLYVTAGYPAVGPNCPSGCPGPTHGTVGSGSGSGGTTTHQ